MDELTMLREQMASVKQSLDRSQIINKTLMRKVMRKSSSWLNKAVWMEAIATPIISVVIYQASINVEISAWYSIVFFIASAIDTALDYKTLRIPRVWFSELDVISLRKKLLKQKMQRKLQYIISVSAAAIWGILWGFQYISKGIGEYMTLDATSTAIILAVVGLIVLAGVWFSLVIYRRAQRTNDELVKQLEEYEHDA